jgi:hypothetical protein
MSAHILHVTKYQELKLSDFHDVQCTILYSKLLSKHGFGENGCSNSHTLLVGIHAFLSVLSIFLS